jgi:hypothetical protein
MDLLLMLLVFVLAFGVFVSFVYLLARWMFPKGETMEEFHRQSEPNRNGYMPKVSRKNPYSFK